MLCERCSRIDFARAAEKEGFLWHPNCLELVNSAKNGCELCCMVWEKRWSGENVQDWFETPEEYDKYNKNTPLRIKTLKTTEQGEMVVRVAFRSPPSSGTFRHICYFCFFELFTDYDSELAKDRLVCGRPVSDLSGSRETYRLARKWFRACIDSHGDSCPVNSDARLPTRVLEVGDSDSDIFIKETGRSIGYWVALSHCWGKKKQLVLDANLSIKNPLKIETLSSTFRDAIAVTRELGFQYVWIDSLCIIQDSKDDWLKESSLMQEYYKNAILTFAADSAAGDHEGFLNKKRPLTTVIKLPYWKEGTQAGFVYARLRMENPFSDNTPLSTRCWTLQEMMLSSRTLHFGPDQQFWDCPGSFYCEAYEGDSQRTDMLTEKLYLKHYFLARKEGENKYADDKTALLNLEPRKRWLNIVDEYTQRALTFESDRLLAISGIAREVYAQTKMTYIAGIWTEDLHRSLLWTTLGAGKKPEKYIAPSWSWASLGFVSDHPVLSTRLFQQIDEFQNIDDSGDTFEAKANWTICETIPSAGSDIFGQIESGKICFEAASVISASKFPWHLKPPFLNSCWKGVEGYKTNIWVESDSDSYDDDSKLEAPEFYGQIICNFDILSPDPDLSARSELFDKVFFLQIASVRKGPGGKLPFELFYALMLVETTKKYVFRRLGVAEIPGVADNLRVGWEVRTIVII